MDIILYSPYQICSKTFVTLYLLYVVQLKVQFCKVNKLTFVENYPKASNICIVKIFLKKNRSPNCPTKTDFLAVSFPSNILHIFTVSVCDSVLMQNECTFLKQNASSPQRIRYILLGCIKTNFMTESRVVPMRHQFPVSLDTVPNFFLLWRNQHALPS